MLGATRHTNFDNTVGGFSSVGSTNAMMLNTNGSFSKPTLSKAIKTKYIVRSRHEILCNERFIPVNKTQAKSEVKNQIIHDLDNFEKD